MENKKYRITEEFNPLNPKLKRIVALVSIIGVCNVGDKGGFIESEYNLQVSGNAWVSGNAQVSGDAQVSGNALIHGNARVSGNAWVSGNACVSGNARVSGDARVSGNACVSGDACVSGNARVSGDAQVVFKISKSSDYLLVGPVGSRDSFLTLSKDSAHTGCFSGTWDELIEKSGDRKYTAQYKCAVELAKVHFSMDRI